MQRHLAAFKALDPYASARGLALATASTRLAHAGTDPTPDTHTFFACTRLVGDLVEFQLTIPRSLRLSCAAAHDERSLRVTDHAHEVMYLGDHTPGLGRIRQVAHTTNRVEAKADQCGALVAMAPQRAADLFDLDGFMCLGHPSIP